MILNWIRVCVRAGRRVEPWVEIEWSKKRRRKIRRLFIDEKREIDFQPSSLSMKSFHFLPMSVWVFSGTLVSSCMPNMYT